MPHYPISQKRIELDLLGTDLRRQVNRLRLTLLEDFDAKPEQVCDLRFTFRILDRREGTTFDLTV